jgi:hypothetical protein
VGLAEPICVLRSALTEAETRSERIQLVAANVANGSNSDLKTSWSEVRSSPNNGDVATASVCPFRPVTVAKVENRTKPKISRKLILRLFLPLQRSIAPIRGVCGRFRAKTYGPLLLLVRYHDFTRNLLAPRIDPQQHDNDGAHQRATREQ